MVLSPHSLNSCFLQWAWLEQRATEVRGTRDCGHTEHTLYPKGSEPIMGEGLEDDKSQWFARAVEAVTAVAAEDRA